VLSNRVSLGGLAPITKRPKPSTHSHDAKGRRQVSPPQHLSADFTQKALMQIAEIGTTPDNRTECMDVYSERFFSIDNRPSLGFENASKPLSVA
jgi:hypothetical protein